MHEGALQGISLFMTYIKQDELCGTSIAFKGMVIKDKADDKNRLLLNEHCRDRF